MKRNPRWTALRRLEGRLTAKFKMHRKHDVQELIALSEIQNACSEKNERKKQSLRKKLPVIAASCLLLVAIIIAPIAFAWDSSDDVVATNASATPLESAKPVTASPEVSQEIVGEVSPSISPSPDSIISVQNDSLWSSSYETDLILFESQAKRLRELEIKEAEEKIPDEDLLTPKKEEAEKIEEQPPKEKAEKKEEQAAKESEKKTTTEKKSEEKKTETKKTETKKTETKKTETKKESSSKKKSSKKEASIEVKAEVELRNDKRADKDPPKESEIAEVLSYEVTAYTHTGEPTSLGVMPKVGTIAVNPKQIPYGTKLYVEGYGYGVAGDTGGFRHSGKKQIDLFMDRESECVKWGRRRKVRVFILKD